MAVYFTENRISWVYVQSLDSRGRFDYGNWVRSTMAISFQDGYLFETKNTVYVLAGDGDEKSANLAAILSLYQ